MAYERKKEQKKRQVKRDPLTGVSVKKQQRDLSQKNKGENLDDYLDDNGHFIPEIFNDENEEECDVFNTTSMAAIAGYSLQYFEERVLPEINTHRVGPIYVTNTNSIIATVVDYRRRQAAKQSEAGKKNSRNLLRWSKNDVSSGGFND